MAKAYKIVKYDMIGKVLYTCEEAPAIEAITVENSYSSYSKIHFVDKGTKNKAFQCDLWEYSTTPKAGAYNPNEKLLPYFATVTEDLPSRFKWKPKVYKNCQLMTERHGSYKQFWHEPTKKVLLIAMNSNYYEPTEN